MQCGSGPGTLYETLTPPSWDDCPYWSRISEAEKVLFEDDDDWVYQGNINDIKQLVGTYPFSLETEEMGQLWTELADAVGNGSVKGWCLVYLILATWK